MSTPLMPGSPLAYCVWGPSVGLTRIDCLKHWLQLASGKWQELASFLGGQNEGISLRQVNTYLSPTDEALIS